MTRTRLPRTIALPFGYRVRVRQVPARELPGCDGEWCAETRTVRIVRSLPERRKRYILYHELVHAVLDAGHHALNDGSAAA